MARPTKSMGLWRQCLDEETEILTPNGFLGIDEFDENQVAGFDIDTGRMSWVDVQSKVIRRLNPEEKMYSANSPQTDIRVTGGHRMIYTGRRQPDRWKFKTAECLSGHMDGYRIPVSGRWEYPSSCDLTTEDIKFIGLFLTDGCLDKNTNAIKLYQSDHHEDEVKYIDRFMVDSRFKYGRVVRRRKTQYRQNGKMIQWSVSKGKPRGTGKHLSGWDAIEKYIDKDISLELFRLSESQFDILLEAINVGDGDKHRSRDWTPRTIDITSAREVFTERLQFMAITRGYRCNVHKDTQNGVFRIHIKKQGFNAMGGSGQKDRSSQLKECRGVDGEWVWCVENRTGALVTRRNGKVAILGNCGGRGLRIDEGKTDCIIFDHGNVIENNGFLDDEIEWSLDGKEKAWTKPAEKKEKKPVQCRVCNLVFEGASVCPDCGSPIKTFGKPVETVDGELKEVGKKKKATTAEKRMWFAMFKYHCEEKGLNPGWASHKFKERFGVWPNKYKQVAPAEPTQEFRNYLRHLNIKWAKRRKAA